MAGSRKAIAEIIEPPPGRVRPAESGGGFEIDEAALARAETVVKSMQCDYVAWARDQVGVIEKLYAKARATPADRGAIIGEIASAAHDVKGNGGTFGYDLMTAIGGSLATFCRAIADSRAAVNDARLEVVCVHIDAMKMVIDRGLEGGGGETGADMVAMLARACELRR